MKAMIFQIDLHREYTVVKLFFGKMDVVLQGVLLNQEEMKDMLSHLQHFLLNNLAVNKTRDYDVSLGMASVTTNDCREHWPVT